VNPPALAAQEKLIMHLDCYDLILNYAWVNNQKTGSSGGRTYGPVVRSSVSPARTRSLKPPMPRASVWPRICTLAVWPGLCAFPRSCRRAFGCQ
jgi:hypothetical protein